MKKVYMDFFAVFLIARVDDGYAATTRTDGRIGLPGGKVDLGETAQEAVLREAKEEGWELPSDTPLELVHAQKVDGRYVGWFQTTSAITPVKLDEYKEKHRGIRPIVVTRSEIHNSGFGNENLLLLWNKKKYLTFSTTSRRL